jgi:PAS domain-containing protein
VNPLGIGIKRSFDGSSLDGGAISDGSEAGSTTTRSRGTRSSRQKGKKGDGSSASSSSSTSSMPSASSMSSMPLMTRDQLREAAAKEVAEQRQAEKAKQEADEGRKGGSKRKLMSSEEKAKANRDRNREHARNTRLRKKAYVAKLTQLVSDLSTQTEAQARERALQVTREREQTTVRRNVLRTLAEYRSTGQTDRYKWATILDENFVCKLPVTPYRSFKQSDIVHNSRLVKGIDEFIADVKSLHICIESIGAPSKGWKEARARGEKVNAVYAVNDEDIIMSGDILMSRYRFGTQNATQCGAECECQVYGMLRIKYTDQNKIISCEFMFDVMSFMQVLQHASCPSAEMPIVPNTITMAQGPSSEARVITCNQPGNPIVHVNAAWTKLCGYTQEESEGRSLALLQGPNTDAETVNKLMEDVSQGHPSSMTVTNYDKNGDPFTVRMPLCSREIFICRHTHLTYPSPFPSPVLFFAQNFLRIYPLSSNKSSTPGQTSHFLGVLEDIPAQASVVDVEA